MNARRGAPGLVVAVVALGGALVACGVPTGDDTYSEIPSAEIPFGLDQTSTSTSTTTTTTTTIVDPPPPTTTTTPVRQEAVDIFFLSRGRLQPVPFDLPAGQSADQIADVLEEGPQPDVGLDTLIEDGLIQATSEAGGVLTVDLDGDTFDRIPSTQQTEAIAQIVLTMLTSVRGIGQVNFTQDGEPIAVKMGNSLLSDVGQPLSIDDYRVLLVRTPTTPGATTTTPPDSVAPPAVTPP